MLAPNFQFQIHWCVNLKSAFSKKPLKSTGWFANLIFTKICFFRPLTFDTSGFCIFLPTLAPHSSCIGKVTTRWRIVMSNGVYGILYSNVHPVSGDTYQSAARDEECFLREVITPIYEVLLKEAKRNNKGKASHTKWRNYDDLNEYFWSDKCFKLGWPMDPKADFFRHDEKHQTNEELLALEERIENDKHRAKVKEKLHICVKGKLVAFCDPLNISISRGNVKKEELSAMHIIIDLFLTLQHGLHWMLYRLMLIKSFGLAGTKDKHTVPTQRIYNFFKGRRSNSVYSKCAWICLGGYTFKVSHTLFIISMFKVQEELPFLVQVRPLKQHFLHLHLVFQFLR
ncbi:hypothetical protein K1719_006271 [Acacia pycnantha]|nr:hypothetical protein K1719_006271 [Acacia pycnantha]